jgi:hypothetical protein
VTERRARSELAAPHRRRRSRDLLRTRPRVGLPLRAPPSGDRRGAVDAGDPAPPRGLDLLDGATVLTAWWVYLTAAIAAALVAVLVVIGIRRFA